jgi:atlastin
LINADDWIGKPDEPLTGFDWKSGTERITKGLIFWQDVFLYDTPRGEKLAIYIMDTQGLFDHKTTTTDNSRIFSLSTLISSIQILNLFNIIQENQLQYLQFATEYARYASSDSEDSPFQSLLILIRDWNSPEEYRYGLRGGNAYLNSFLEIHDYQSPELQSVRRYIKTSFEKLECFLMPHPGKKVATDKFYDGRWREIDEDFVSFMNELFQHLFKKLQPKTINSVPIKPDELLVFISTYIQNFGNDSMPNAVNIYESTLEKQFRILMAKSIDIYIESVSSHDQEIQGEQDINNIHLAAKEKALKFFNSGKKFGSYTEGNTFKKELVTKIEEIFKQWKGVSLVQIQKLNEQKSKTNEQLQQLEVAQNQDSKAKAELDQAVKEVNEARIALQNAKTDTEEARQEAEAMKQRLQEAEKKRAEAIENEKQTRDWLEKMRNEKDFFEQEYNRLKASAANQIGGQLGAAQDDSGFGRMY